MHASVVCTSSEAEKNSQMIEGKTFCRFVAHFSPFHHKRGRQIQFFFGGDRPPDFGSAENT
jgi:hypothetical protein